MEEARVESSTPQTRVPFEVDLNGASFLPGKKHLHESDAFIEKDKEIASFEGFYAPWWKTLLYYLTALFTAGFSLLVCKWSPKLNIFLSLSSCDLVDAQFVRITLVDGRVDLERISRVLTSTNPKDSEHSLHQSSEAGSLIAWQSAVVHRLLEYRCQRYFFVDYIKTFVPVPAIPKDFNDQLQKTAAQLAVVAQPKELDAYWDVGERQIRYGLNEMRIPVKSIGMLVFNSMWHPFYVFQYASVLLWVAGEAYYSYAICIFLITAFSIISEAVEANKNLRRMADLAYYSLQVEVLRDGNFQSLPSPKLVPGDIVLLDSYVLPCDIVLLRGECIVDENMLTGESVPLRKVAYSPVADGLSFGPDKNSQCTLFSGTKVAQARGTQGQKAIGMVCRTGFYSAKGQLLRSILFPKEVEASFIRDSLIFIGFMLILCVGLFIWAAIALMQAGAQPWKIGLRFLDMITIAVPPALPACLTIATVFSIGRLRKKDVFVTGPDRITLAGQLDIVCFDKTGTLTEQGLDLQGIIPVNANGQFTGMEKAAQKLPLLLLQLLASCHGLARLGEDLVGDPLDQKLFEATHWALIDETTDSSLPLPAASSPSKAPRVSSSPELGSSDKWASQMGVHAAASHAEITTYVRPPNAAHSYGILKRFEFSAALQRMAVVVLAPDGSTNVFAKGSPEMIRSMVVPDSIPSDFDALLGTFTREGLRVLALAHGDASEVPTAVISGWSQEETERQIPLRLVGLAVMENPIRPCTAGVIKQLQDANLQTVMVTGDHVRTAISIAHICGITPATKPICMIDGSDPHSDEPPFKLSIVNMDGTTSETTAQALAASVLLGEMACAVTGKGFNRLVETLDSDLLPAALRQATVYARMSPDNKRDLMQLLGGGLDGLDNSPHLGLMVGFCGDGANDCGALKAAHVGVSLCEAEASVAAPMTSKLQSIGSMITVMSEGRCTLMATYQIFQFIIGYALVQAFMTNLMYTYALNVGNYQFLIQDLFFTTVSAGLMGYTLPRQGLSSKKPVKRVMSLPIMTSTVLQMIVIVVFQLASIAALQRQPGYMRAQGDSSLTHVESPENTTVYLVAMFQFIILALVFNKAKPHRSPLYTNIGLSISLVLQLGFTLYSLYSIDKFNSNVQQLVDESGPVDSRFRSVLLVLMVINLVAAVSAQAISGLVQKLVRWMFPPPTPPLILGNMRTMESVGLLSGSEVRASDAESERFTIE